MISSDVFRRELREKARYTKIRLFNQRLQMSPLRELSQNPVFRYALLMQRHHMWTVAFRRTFYQSNVVPFIAFQAGFVSSKPLRDVLKSGLRIARRWYREILSRFVEQDQSSMRELCRASETKMILYNRYIERKLVQLTRDVSPMRRYVNETKALLLVKAKELTTRHRFLESYRTSHLDLHQDLMRSLLKHRRYIEAFAKYELLFSEHCDYTLVIQLPTEETMPVEQAVTSLHSLNGLNSEYKEVMVFLERNCSLGEALCQYDVWKERYNAVSLLAANNPSATSRQWTQVEYKPNFKVTEASLCKLQRRLAKKYKEVDVKVSYLIQSELVLVRFIHTVKTPSELLVASIPAQKVVYFVELIKQ